MSAAVSSFAWRILEEVADGLVLVSPGGAVLHANRRARQEFALGRVLHQSADRIGAATDALTAQLLAAVALAAEGNRQVVALRCPAGTMQLACVPAQAPVAGGPCPVILMFAREPFATADPPAMNTEANILQALRRTGLGGS